MQLTADYKLENDEYNITLKKRTIVQKGDRIGEEDWTPIKYYRTYEHALEGFINLQLLSIPDEDELTHLKDKICELKGLYRQLAKKLESEGMK